MIKKDVVRGEILPREPQMDPCLKYNKKAHNAFVTQLFKKGLVGACLRPREMFFSAAQNNGANQRLESTFSQEGILIESRLML